MGFNGLLTTKTPTSGAGERKRASHLPRL